MRKTCSEKVSNLFVCLTATRLSPEKLDPTNKASDALLNSHILLRFENYGWCKGSITDKVTNRSRRIGQDNINFVATFDIDEGQTTDLSLDSVMYDTSPSADYQSWMLIEEEGEGAAPAEGAAPMEHGA
jgi:hypothetical protein